jgi:lysophospholipase L1-like esterase
MSELVGLARARRLPIVFVVFPMEVQLSAEARALYRERLGVRLAATTDEPQRRLAALARAHGAPLVDLLPRYRRASGAPLYLRNKVISHDWTHPSSAGHELAADEVFRALARLGLVPGVSGS